MCVVAKWWVGPTISPQSNLTTCFVRSKAQTPPPFPVKTFPLRVRLPLSTHSLTQFNSVLDSPPSETFNPWRPRECYPSPTPVQPRAFSPERLGSCRSTASLSPGDCLRRRRPGGPSLVAPSTTLRFRSRRKVSPKP